MNGDAITLIKEFIISYLEGDIDKLVDFDLKKLAKDDVNGCPDRKFDALVSVCYGYSFLDTAESGSGSRV